MGALGDVHLAMMTAGKEFCRALRVSSAVVIAKDGTKYNGGYILDPNNGKEYKCFMYLESDGQKLVVRGYIGFSLIGWSQTWVRQGK